MKERLKILPMKVLAAFSLGLMFFPAILLLGRYFLPDQPALWYLLPLYSVIAGMLGYLFPKKIFQVAIPVLCAGALLAYGIVSLAPASFLRVVPILPCLVIILLIPPAWSSLPWDEWHPAFWMIGACLQLIAQFMATFPSFSGTAQALSFTFVIYAFILVMMLNSKGLRNGMHGSQKAPMAMKKRNKLLVIALFVPALIASGWGILADALDRAWAFLRHIIWQAILWFLSLFSFADQNPTGSGGGGQQDMLMGMEASEPSAFAVFMEKVLIVVAVLLMAVILFFALKILIKKLIILWKKIMERLRKYASSINEDYVDEAESTLNLDEKTKVLKERLQKAFSRQPRQIPWNELDGRGRVRRLYQQFIKRKPEMQQKTAREALLEEKWMDKKQAEAFASLYEKARYSDHEISTDTADQLRSTIK